MLYSRNFTEYTLKTKCSSGIQFSGSSITEKRLKPVLYSKLEESIGSFHILMYYSGNSKCEPQNSIVCSAIILSTKSVKPALRTTKEGVRTFNRVSGEKYLL